ncbi:TetR family transcriptional regulator [Secundilactobacillus pentosiphilus]|uniref:TetR family transcriptional regulator n=1 Tax=Secundilactobacillus pentosiphilus TaxID=1714682 RepID=A0A1Z5IMY2_9LACO|nr:TetR family transcriptional regulator [Secundilactobacillus pentosiphilus]
MNKNDLRYIKTEDNLKQALLTLLDQMSLKKITVKMICEVARCSRNTFYLHHEVKEDLYNTVVSNVLNSMQNAFQPRVDQVDQITDDILDEYTEGIMTSVASHKDSLRTLILQDNGLFFKQFTEIIQNTVLKGSSELANHFTVDTQLYSSYLAGAISGFIFNWFKNPICDLPTATKALKIIHRETMAICIKELKKEGHC